MEHGYGAAQRCRALAGPAINRRGRNERTSANLARIDQCRDSLERIATLANQPDQTLETIRSLIRKHDDICRDHLNAAVASSQR